MTDSNSFSGAPAAGAWQRPEDLVGTILADRYKVRRVLGEGGMGSVFEGEHVTLRKRVAIKVLHPELCRDQTQVDRFLQEARAASMIGHENIVDIVDFGPVPGGSVFFAMEFLEGEDLSDLLNREGRLKWSRARELMLQIVRALRAAHAKGIIHRDLKPANCFLVSRSSGRDFVKLLDFGIAKVTDPEGGESGGLTRTGAVFGTAKYMAPEQACGEPADQRTDVYAAAICLYEFLTGQVPYDGDNFMRVLSRHLTEPLTMPSTMAPDAGITPAVESIIVKALSKKPDDRYQSMAEFEEALLAVGPDGNLAGAVYEGPPQIHAGADVPKGGTLWLPQGAGGAPASQPPEGRGGTLMLDPNDPNYPHAGQDPDYGTVKLDAHGWAGQQGAPAPSQPPPVGGTQMMDGMGQAVLHGRPGSGAVATRNPGAAPSVPPGAPTTDPNAPQTSPPPGYGNTTGDYTMFATEQRSPMKMILIAVIGVIAAVGGGLGLAAVFLSEDDEDEKQAKAAVVAPKDDDGDKKEQAPELPPEPSIPEPNEAEPEIPEPETPEPETPEPETPEPEPEPTKVKPDPKPDRPTSPSRRRPKRDKIKPALEASDWSKGLRKTHRAAAACAGWLPGMKVTVQLTVNKDGRVVSAKSNEKGPTASCVVSAAKKARFPKTQSPLQFHTEVFKK